MNWSTKVQSYLAFRRSFGFELLGDEGLLESFARLADSRHAEYLDLPLTTDWAQSTKHATHFTWGRRIEVLRGFAKYLCRLDTRTFVPPPNMFGPTHRRLVPHIFTEEEIRTLLDATERLKPIGGLRGATCQTVFGLLASSGLRISEALNLIRDTVDLDSGMLDVRNTKFHQCRFVPLHATVVSHLLTYAQRRDREIPTAGCDRFFIRQDGQPVSQRHVLYALQSLCKELGWTVRGDHVRHRLHDLRHTFIVRSVLRLYEQGADVDRGIPILSTYVGHAKLEDTYWYLTGIPELMSVAAKRFHAYVEQTP